MHPKATVLARFWARVTVAGPDDCWPPANGKLTRQQFWIGSVPNTLPRTAYFVAYGEWPTPQGNHTCDHGWCCNPAHIYAGTKRQNAQDAWERGQLKKGVRHYASKLTEATVHEARARYAAGEPIGRMARAYGVHRITLRDAIRRITWRHVT